MKIRHSELVIDKENPFLNCKLNRVQYANVLTDIVTNYAEGFVLAINNEWGTGKTTFVKMWQQQLINNGFRTLYFNAWENDFEINPLVAIMAELKSLIPKLGEDVTYKSMLQKGAILTKSILPALIKGLAKKYIDTEEIVDLIENSTKAATEMLEQEINEYAERKEKLVQFREELVKYIKGRQQGKPIVFIIDELDRCKPSYAVELLEQIKHFFSVEGIVFALAIDKEQLGHAVRGVYGSELINSEEYLRRFIDLEYTLPKPSTENFGKYMYDFFSFKDFFDSGNRSKFRGFENDANLLLRASVVLFDYSKASLRQQEKIWGLTRLILSSFQSDNYVFTNLLFLLIFIKNLHPELYRKIESNSISLQTLSDEFCDLIPSDFMKYKNINIVYLQAMLLKFYNNQNEDLRSNKLYSTNASGTCFSEITTKLIVDPSYSSLASCFQSIDKDWESSRTPITFLLKKINLTERLNFEI